MRKLKLLLVLCMVAIAASASKTVYLVPGAWDVADDTERYALYMFNSDTDNAWVSFTEGTGGILSAQFDETYSKMIICRMDGASTENNWTNRWNESANLDAPAVDGMYYVNKSPTCGNSPWLSIINPSPNPGDDMTSAIANSNIDGSADGWTLEGQCRYFTSNTGFDGTTKFIEYTNWGSSWDASASQTINHLHNGYYRVRAAGQMSGVADCWMKLVANGKENFFSRNGDTNGNILADGTETTLGAGKAGWRYSTTIAKVTNGTLTISVVGHSDSKERWANADAFTLTYLGEEIAPNTDVTDFINNWDFWGCFNGAANFNGWTADAPNGGNVQKLGDSDVEYWIGTPASGAFDYYQTVTELPEGRYAISASMFSTQGSGPNGNAGVYGTSNSITAFAGVTIDSNNENHHTYSTDIFVNNGELRLGVKNIGTLTANWFGVDWIKLNYLGKVVQDYAVALPTDGSMAADTWYYFDITAAADDYNATATTLGDIICTTNENMLVSATSGDVTLTATNNSFAVNRYYVKSSSTNNLVVEASSYIYSVSEATADMTFIQPGQTVTVNYTVSTNDPAATLRQNYSGVTFNGAAIPCTSTASGFTFVVPDLAVASEFELVIPANAIGYESGSTFNAAQTITLKTPAIFDGLYYFYNTDTKKYMSRGGNYGTQAITDDYGVPAFLAFDGNGQTKVKFFDNYKYLSDGGWLYADNGTGGNFLVEAVADGYKFRDATTSKFVAIFSDVVVGDAEEGVNLQGTSNVWALETPAAYAAKDNATTLADAQAAAAATAAGLSSITTKAGLESELAANYGETPITITGAKAEKYNVNAEGNPLTEKEYVKENVTGLKPGLYRLTVDAFQRASSNERVAAADGASSLVYVYAGTAKTRIKSVMAYGANDAYASDYAYNGKHYPNNEASAYVALETGNYQNVVYVYVADGGDGTGSLTFGINNPQNTNAGGYPNALWAAYNNFSLTYFEAKATDTDKQALAEAIADAETKTLGFETGEYAPYNNVAALEALATAKAIVPDASSSETVTAATAALTGATWTANTGEVNAFGDPTFAKSGNDGAQLGWATDHNAGLGGAVHARAFVLNSGDGNYANLAAFGQGDGTRSAGYFRFDGTNSAKTTTYTYGSTAGYTMPLKAATYLMSAQLGGWGQVDKDVVLQIVNESNEVVGSQTVHTPSTGVHAGGSVVNVKFEFEAVAGNYKLLLKNGSTDADNAIVISNLELKKAPVYAVVGCKQGNDNDKAIFSDAWDTATTADILTLINGVYTKTYTNLTLDKQTIDFKVVKQGAEVTWYPAGTGNNHSINIPVNGVYNITFTFDGNDVTAEAIQTAESFTISAAGWATAVTYNAVDFTGNEKIKAYLATVSGNQVTLTEATKVPAGTPLVLKGETAAVSVIESAEAVTNDLQGSNQYDFVINDEMDAQFNFYGLTVSSGTAKFAKLNKGTIQPGKAYLKLTKSTTARELNVIFADETTGINAVATETNVEGVYNMNGQRVNAPSKGLYIVNGKKVVIK